MRAHAPHTGVVPTPMSQALQPRMVRGTRRSLAPQNNVKNSRGMLVIRNLGAADCGNAIFTNKHKFWSTWYTPSMEEYKKYVQQDFLIRKYINYKLGQGGITDIEIERQTHLMDNVKVIIYAITPSMISSELKEVKEFLQNYHDIQMGIKLTEPSYQGSAVAAHLLAGKLEAGTIRANNAMRQTVEWLQSQGVENIKVAIKGRIDGNEQARGMKTETGSIPYSTYPCHVDYYYKTAFTQYGAMGVKIWTYTGEPRRIVLEKLGHPQLPAMSGKNYVPKKKTVYEEYQDPEWEIIDDLEAQTKLDVIAESQSKKKKRIPKNVYKFLLKYGKRRLKRLKRKNEKYASARKGVSKEDCEAKQRVLPPFQSPRFKGRKFKVAGQYPFSVLARNPEDIGITIIPRG